MVDNNLPKFGISLRLGGINPAYDSSALQEIDSELSMRPHILKYQNSWANTENTEIKIYVETEGLEPNATGLDMAEEVFEVANAVLNSVEGIHVDVISVHTIDD